MTNTDTEAVKAALEAQGFRVKVFRKRIGNRRKGAARVTARRYTSLLVMREDGGDVACIKPAHARESARVQVNDYRSRRALRTALAQFGDHFAAALALLK